MKQYNAIKVKYPDAMLLFRVGDFYETFGEDAKKAAGVLGIILTKRGAGSDSETALAGFPHHSLNTYLPKLVKAGMRVAICDQLENPKMTKTIVKRGVTELITPGVSLNDEVLQSKSNNFLAAVHFGKRLLGVSFLDVSTGEYLLAQGNEEYIDKLLQNFNPSEVLVQKQFKKKFKELFEDRFYTFFLDDWVFQKEYSDDSLHNHFGVNSLQGFGVQEMPEGIVAAGAVLYYLSETQHNKLQHIKNISRIAEDKYVWMDRFTVRNLELYNSTSHNAVTLLKVIDKTISPMGGRLLKRWLALPLKSVEKIHYRHELVKHCIENDDFLETIQYQLQQISDIERLISKVATGKVSPRETVLLKNSLQAILPIKEITELAHSKGIIVVVDGCQGAPHLRLDMQDLDCDFYAISCHKMYGPTGLGILYGKKKWLEELPPYQGGGGMINEVKKDRISYGDLPNKFEAGTMATAQVIAFDQSIKFLEKIGIDNVVKHEADLVEYGQKLLQKNNSVKLIGNPKNKGGVLSFTIEGIHPHDVATILDEDGVAIRAGHHCCQILHDKLNIPASSRASVGVYNTREDLDKLNDAINNCKKIFNQK